MRMSKQAKVHNPSHSRHQASTDNTLVWANYAYSPSAAQDAAIPPKKTKSRRRKIIKRAALALLAILIVVGGWYGWKFYRAAANATGNNNPLQLFGALNGTPLKTTNGRVNILLAGYSNDDPKHDGADLTDSIMIMSIDPSDKSAVVMSVPRDLYVDIPDHGYSKINATYEYGQAEKFSEAGYAYGGMGLLEKTVSQKFGIDFNYYALINYTAFRDAVNAVGGVTVTINSSDKRGLYDPNTATRLPNGSVTLTGQQALDLARSRGDGYGSYGFPQSDFSRTQNQQMILLALKGKAAQTSTVANPQKLSELADAIGNNVRTDLKIGEMQTLYKDVKAIDNSNIKTVNLNSFQGKNLLMGYTTKNGQSALIPSAGIDDYDRIQAAVESLLSPPATTQSQ